MRANSLARNHALVEGNGHLALAGVIAFLGGNGGRLMCINHDAYNVIVAVTASASLIANRLR